MSWKSYILKVVLDYILYLEIISLMHHLKLEAFASKVQQERLFTGETSWFYLYCSDLVVLFPIRNDTSLLRQSLNLMSILQPIYCGKQLLFSWTFTFGICNTSLIYSAHFHVSFAKVFVRKPNSLTY